MTITTAAGAKFYIGPANSSAADSSTYSGLTYVEVGAAIDLGEFGLTYADVTTDHLGDPITIKLQGQADYGSPTFIIDHDSSDSGQTNLAAASEVRTQYAFKIVLDDAGTGSPSSGTTYYFRGPIMKRTTQIGTANNMVRLSVTVGISAKVIKVAAV